MARLTACFLLLGLCTWLAAAGQDGAITVVNGILGESVTFPLKLRSPQEVENIAWSSPDLSVAFVQPNPGEVGPRVSVTHQSFRGRINVLSDSCDLVISHLRLEDSRVYTAYINSKHGTETRHFSLSVFRRLGTATITRSITPTLNGTCNVTLTCWVEGGGNVSFTWTPPGTGPTLFLSHGPERLKGAVTCTARNPVSSTNASVDAESLCTDVLWGSGLSRSWVVTVVPLLLALALGVILLFLRLRARRQLPPGDTSSEKTVYAQVTVPPAAARVYEAGPSSAVRAKKELSVYSVVQCSDKTRPGSPRESTAWGASNYANVV